ncbi:MAG: hypothetical protein CHACPFDD_01049 [Phycisphaerae bacterium]|nr:hypothetical protein [Phycisphaerae bacterium]
MSRTVVWDLPTRIFHWALAACFLAAFAIANFTDDESPWFPLHMLLGLTVGLMVVLRVVWGFIGSRHALFRSFVFGPAAVAGDLRDSLAGSPRRFAGHRPGSSYAIFALLVLALGLVVTGLLTRGGEGLVGAIHEVFAWCMIALVAVHVAGVVVHSVRTGENVTLAMINGRKDAAPHEAIRSTHPLAAVVFVALTALWAGGLVWNYDPAARRTAVPLLGTPINLGEAGEHSERADGGPEDDDDD